MRRFFPLAAVLWIFLSAVASIWAQTPGTTYKVESHTEEWVDAARDDRVVPIKAYMPVDASEPRPVILFSHGLGGSREGYAYLGEYWASHGYICIHLQHIGSDESVWRDVSRQERLQALRDATKDVSNSMNRPLDVFFVIDKLEQLNADDTSLWHNKLDLDRIGMAGHSYGAFTTMAVAGQAYVGRDGKSRSVGDERIKAAIVMSAQAPKRPEYYDESYSQIKIPMYFMTGTHDTSMITPETKAADRRVAFDHMPTSAEGGPDSYLVTFTNGDHMVFSGRTRRAWNRGPGGDDALFQKHIKESGLAFWNAYLMDSEQDRHWLREGDFKQELGEAGVFEVKP